MKKTEEEIKRFMASYKEAKYALENAKELYLRMYTTATSAGGQSQNGNFSSGFNCGDRIGNGVAALAEVEETIKSRLRALQIRKRDIEYCISRVPYPRVQKILTMTYIDGHDRSYISRELSIGRQSVTNDRKKGIAWIAENINFKGL